MISLILILPALGFITSSLFGRLIGKGAGYLTTTLVSLSFFISFYFLVKNTSNGSVFILELMEWIVSDSMFIAWKFCFDSLVLVMLVVVTLISSLVHLYSMEYMENDPHFPRFMSYLSLFTFFMIILVTANNFLQMFIGWEGVGVSSYLLINFWFTRIQANKAAIKAMLVNRVGDFFLLLGIFLIYINFNSLDYDVVFNTVSVYKQTANIELSNIYIIDIICLFLFFGAMGKSAQIGLHTWLPDAMEGPTPVSALIHAATMVTAGVFLLARCCFLFENSSIAGNVVVIVGSITAFFAATTGLFQNDLKKVIAYSTCSQLGYMVFACGLSNYEVGIFHLSNHAFFKALLFLGAGSVIHAISDEQDMRRMGGLKNLLPFTYAVFIIGSLALTGFPFLTGFYSKDVILEVSGSNYNAIAQFAYHLGLLAAFCTAYYSIRSLFLVFLSKSNLHKTVILHAHECSKKMGLPLLILAFFSIIIGYATKEMFIGFGALFWDSAIIINPINYILVDIEFLKLHYKLLPLIFSILGMTCAYYVYTIGIKSYFHSKQAKSVKNVFYFFNKKWFFDRIYNGLVVQKIMKKSYFFFYQDIDRGLIEKLGPIGLYNVIYNCINFIKNIQSGFVIDYLNYFFIAIAFSCVYVVYPLFI